MFLQKPSPFTLKAKSRIVEILLLRKNEATIISNNFPNIWRHIHIKSYRNLIGLKKLALKALRQYYNSNFFHSDNNEQNFGLNLDVSGYFSFSERPRFANKIPNNERLNLIKPSNNNPISHKRKLKEIKQKYSFNIPLMKIKQNKTKRSSNSKFKIIPTKNESIISSNISSFNNTDSAVKRLTNITPKDFDENKSKNNIKNLNNDLKYTKKKTFEKSAFTVEAKK
jgi:hypothetical protein